MPGDEPVPLTALAQRLGRNRHNVCRKARALGLTNARRHKRASAERVTKGPRFASEDERRAFQAASRRAWHAANPHPRGMLGKKYSEAARKRISSASAACWADPRSKLHSPKLAQMRSDRMVAFNRERPAESCYSRCKRGKRDDLGDIHFRSAWEANYARYLNLMVAQGRALAWEYEPRDFFFEEIKRGTRSYKPDFLVRFPDGHHEWHEVKGWLDPQSKTRLARMAKFFPDEKIVVIGEAWFKQAVRGGLASCLPGWER